MMLPVSNFGIKCMSMGFLVKPEESIVWRGPMVMGAIEKMIHGTIWYTNRQNHFALCVGVADAERGNDKKLLFIGTNSGVDVYILTFGIFDLFYGQPMVPRLLSCMPFRWAPGHFLTFIKHLGKVIKYQCCDILPTNYCLQFQK
jgi:hypothetical protein